ncbi:MAG: ABC transporter permease [Patescibacteria group bacterium]
MWNNTKTVAKFEYKKTVKRLGFWITVLMLPLFFLFIWGIMFYTANVTEEGASASALSEQNILVVDEASFLLEDTLPENLSKSKNIESAKKELEQGKAEAVIILPNDFSETAEYKVFANDRGLTGNSAYASFAEELIKESLLSRMSDKVTEAIILGNLKAETVFYTEDGNIKDEFDITNFILPAIGFLIFFLAVFMGSQYLLQSVTEEKENRVIESLLSTISKKDLINGKIIGLSFVVITQITAWVLLGAIIGIIFLSVSDFSTEALPIGDVLSKITVMDGVITLACVLLGFFFFASVMVGVGSVGTTQRESQQLSSIFIILSIIPIYFSSLIIGDPTGTISQFFTYFPFSSALIVMIRSSLGALSYTELILALILNIVYVIVAFWFAQKLFQIGMLMYNRKPKWREIVQTFKKTDRR